MGGGRKEILPTDSSLEVPAARYPGRSWNRSDLAAWSEVDPSLEAAPWKGERSDEADWKFAWIGKLTGSQRSNELRSKIAGVCAIQ